METFLQQFQDLKIQLEEIILATDNFNDEKNCIGVGGFGKVYKGEVSHSKGRSMAAIKRLDPRYGQGIPEFLKEITMLSRYKHENLISLLGFCYQTDEMILVYEYASRGSLDRYLNSPHLTWSQRLKICLDAAKGLSYLHDPRETHQRLIHCDVKSSNILLDDQWKGKVSDFGFSIMGPANEQQSVIVTVAAGTPGYCDPQYAMTHTLTKESDVYSFGVVLFEVLCGTLCCTYKNGAGPLVLVRVWIESYKQKRLNDIIFKHPTIQPIDESSLETFSYIAYRCLMESREVRPKMAEVVAELMTALRLQKAYEHEFQSLKIPLEEIISATNNFDDEKNYIGGGGFMKVYKGEVSHSKGRGMAAIMRLDRRYGQGTPEFFKELTTLSRYVHENIISLLGFCYEGDEMILVYEYASRGSLDRHLNSSHLTWTLRLKICLGAAKGLSYLHNQQETHQRLIHCDVKSNNILLGDQWCAKVSDLGLSVMGTFKEQHSVIIATPGYCDQQYAMTHTLSKESDVYSFGVVLFEVLCGTLCCTYSNGGAQQILVPTWIESYKQKKLNDIIFKSPSIQPMDQSSLETFSYIAYRCLKESREDRPKMAEIVTELENALESQEFCEWKPLFNYEKMIKSAEPPLNYSSIRELLKLLSKGVLLNNGKMWFSLNKNGEHCEMISFAECLDSEFESYPWLSHYNSRFPAGPYQSLTGKFKTHVKTQFLSPWITYTVNLVFKFMLPKKARKCHDPIFLKYKLQGETKFSISYLALEREDGWCMAELYQFDSDQRIVDIKILFDGFDHSYAFIEAEGIEFRPLEKVLQEDEKLDIQPIVDSDVNWEKKLPTDYEDIMKLSIDSLQWTTKKEAYSIVCKGFLINNGQEWISVDKNGKKCHILSARAADIWGWHKDTLSLPESRFGEAVLLGLWRITIRCHIQSQLVSSQTRYATYLVYKLPIDQSRFEAPLEVKIVDGKLSSDSCWYIYLVSPQTPVIRPEADQNTHNPLNRPKIKGLPQQRKDGWMEVQIWEFQTATTTEMIPIHLQLTNCAKISSANIPRGLIVQGVEFRAL